ncbi:MAG: hypothetical protein AAGC77_08255 [Pseudomonadota bacterium]
MSSLSADLSAPPRAMGAERGRLESPVVLGALLFLLTIGAFLAPPMTFIIDGAMYLEMARAMAERGSLHIAENGGVEGAPPLWTHLTHVVGDRVYPQYPSGYAFLATPFYSTFGVRGLMLMNALSVFCAVILTYQITIKLYTDRWIAGAASLVFLFATFITTYAFSIWPHGLAIALWLGAVYIGVLGSQTKSGKTQSAYFAAAGALIGIGVNIRLDAVLLLPILILWLRLFVLPAHRLAPPFLCLGAAPGFVFAAYLNFLKFGIFTPLTYGPSEPGNAVASAYALLMALGAVGLIGICLVNVSEIIKKIGYRRVAVAAAIGFALALVFVWPMAFRVAKGVYVLVINLQAHDAYYQAGVDRNDYGHLLFWGYPKKALIQSIAFLPLIIIPLVYALRGRHLNAVMLASLSIAAPIVFYSLNQWHGGGSYNMRYFIPALPFIAMLSAVTLRHIAGALGEPTRPYWLGGATLAGLIFVSMLTIGGADDALFAPAALYPQWLIAVICLTTMLVFLARPKRLWVARSAMAGAALAISYSAFVSLGDESGNEQTRAEQLALSNAAIDALPRNAFVLTPLPVFFINAPDKDIQMMVATEDNAATSVQALRAFEAAGRCVYAHNILVARLLAAEAPQGVFHPEPLRAGSLKFPDEPRLAFYGLQSQSEACRF